MLQIWAIYLTKRLNISIITGQFDIMLTWIQHVFLQFVNQEYMCYHSYFLQTDIIRTRERTQSNKHTEYAYL